MVAAFDVRRTRMVALLNDMPGVSCVMPRGAFYAFPNITGTGLDSATMQDRLLQETGVAAIAGTSFGRFGEAICGSVAPAPSTISKRQWRG